MSYSISSEKDKLNVEWIHKYLTNTAYWSKGRSKEAVVKTIENSLCIGVYTENNIQVGFARVVTDYAVFAWVMDVFVDKTHRGKGIGKMIVDHIVNHTELKKVQGIGLKTKDAHMLYNQYGFKTIEDPEVWMFKKNMK